MQSELGKKVNIRIDGLNVKGRIVKDLKDRLVVVGEDGEPVYVVKNKIAMYKTSLPDDKWKPLYVFACACPEIKCRGVRCTKVGSEPTAKDYESMMEDCECKNDKCTKGCFGDIASMSRDMLLESFSDIMVGEYPEPDEPTEKED